MAAALALLTALCGRFSALLTVGTDGGGNYGYYAASAFGSLNRTTFVDGGGTTRTVYAVQWDRISSGSLILRLQGTGISNSDTTFTSIVLNGALFTRASATYTSNDSAGATRWLWAVNTSGYPSSGTATVSIN